MKHLTGLICGMLLMYGLQHFSEAEAEEPVPKIQIDYYVDYYSVDDIDLKLQTMPTDAEIGYYGPYREGTRSITEFRAKQIEEMIR